MVLTITLNPAIDRVYFVDSLVKNEVNRASKVSVTAGGKGINVAKVVTTLGGKAEAFGFAGGKAGEFIRDEVEKLGVAAKFTLIAGETRTNCNITDKNGSTELLDIGASVAQSEQAAFLDTLEKNINLCSVVAACGSLPSGIDCDFYAKIIAIAKKYNKKIIADTSGEALKKAINAKPFAIKPNKFELSKYLGEEVNSIESVAAACKTLEKNGVELPIVTLGENGCVAAVNGEVYHFFIEEEVKVVNAVGSGDSFVGGLAFGLSCGMDNFNALKLGVASGTANTQFLATGQVSVQLVDKFLKKVEAEKL